MISIQHEDFDLNHEYLQLRDCNDGDGAIVTFSGLVRDYNADGSVSGLFLEHYPGMTEKSLMDICVQARAKWPLGQIRIIHRIGQLNANEQIVFVGVTSAHRAAAFSAAEFIMDYLKTQAPIWKQEHSAKGPKWVEAKDSDVTAANKW
ncbi:molybdopterin synthase catalytic subunit [Paraglaciecola mesophila KMM 241]|uniref:Molybdopterin synthase catalytic subunit n=1 Tax=Paraglaciecola mesophila KMM 241 TaxID=1128912 RepID=K6XUV8_9ALTE|nr:molybdopterin synthase catalytic subunit MoaE [Paraglaciecola mesophila]GAC24399.1 molybdopterin synthase catalytic subunit [Paraglaciecola mesophila KMM 241]